MKNEVATTNNSVDSKPTTGTVLWVLVNGSPDEWAIDRAVPLPENYDGVYSVGFDGVPDDIATRIEESGKPSYVWDELCKLPIRSSDLRPESPHPFVRGSLRLAASRAVLPLTPSGGDRVSEIRTQ